MGFGGALFAVTAATAVSQISQGYAQKSENDYNATLLQGKANLIDTASDIEQGQITRAAGKDLSSDVAKVAKQGTGLSGSALAVMMNSQRQFEIDKAISKLNYTMESNYTRGQADAQSRAGKAAVRSGYSGAFSSLLQGATNYAMYKMPTGHTTFDTGSQATSADPLALKNYGGGTAPYKAPKMSIFR